MEMKLLSYKSQWRRMGTKNRVWQSDVTCVTVRLSSFLSMNKPCDTCCDKTSQALSLANRCHNPQARSGQIKADFRGSDQRKSAQSASSAAHCPLCFQRTDAQLNRASSLPSRMRFR